MKQLFKDYLFAHKVVIGQENENAIYSVIALAEKFSMRVIKGAQYASPECIKYTAEQIGQEVPAPFYVGFPQSVLKIAKEKDGAYKLAFDQLVSYVRTYGFNQWDQAVHSIVEEPLTRIALKEYVEPTDISIVTEEQGYKLLQQYVEDALAGTRPLNDDTFQVVIAYVQDFNYMEKIPNIASKNTAIKLLVATRDTGYSKFIQLPDVLKVVEKVIDAPCYYTSYRYRPDLKKLNLKNQDRKFITKLLDEKLSKASHAEMRDCHERKKLWNGLLHHIHYKPGENVSAWAFVNTIRGDVNLSTYATTEKKIKEQNVPEAARILREAKGAGAVLRNLEYYISRCSTEQEVQRVLQQAESTNAVILFQLLLKYSTYNPSQREGRIFTFHKNGLLKTHAEFADDVLKRKSWLNEMQVTAIQNFIREQTASILKGRLNRVFIDKGADKIAIPLKQSTGNVGFGILSSGSRVAIPACKKLRCFTYWEKVNDIDLSAFGLNVDGSKEEFSWRSMWGKQSDELVFSGDVTSGFNGGSEYFDLDIGLFKKNHPSTRYIVFCNNVFSGVAFKDVVCRAGFMVRDKVDSGEIYEPKTVKSSYTITCDSTYAYLFAIDLQSRELIWLNLGRDSCSRIAASDNMGFLQSYFHMTDELNIKHLFELCATEVVADPKQADVIVSDAEFKLQEGQVQYKFNDIEKITRLVEGK